MCVAFRCVTTLVCVCVEIISNEAEVMPVLCFVVAMARIYEKRPPMLRYEGKCSSVNACGSQTLKVY